MPHTVTIDRIVPQKDEVRVGSEEIPLSDFFEGRGKGGDIIHFKRFVVSGAVSDGRHAGSWQAIIDVRGHTVIISAGPNCPLTSYGVFWCLDVELSNWNHRRLEQHERPLLEVYSGHERHPVPATTRDGLWLAAVLHQIRDLGGFTRRDVPDHFVRKESPPQVS